MKNDYRAFAATALFGLAILDGRAAVGAVDGKPALHVPVLAQRPSIGGAIDATWASAARLALARDFTNRSVSDEDTTVAVAQDARSLDIAFDVTQHEAVEASNETNGPGVMNDDYVGVYLSPDGPNAFQYGFFANPRGARYQSSSENTAYSPPWTAVCRRTAHGYTVTMSIPLSVIRSGGRVNWRAQFVRSTVHSNALDIWAYDERATSASDATYFGTVSGIGASSTARRPQARAQIYTLAEATTPSYGGDTSRLGADLSVPITPTASFVASLHPDFSNVEVDQQTIAPTAFAHQYAEVRPFFSQVSPSFNAGLVNLNAPVLFYTPAIPTFRDGYAVEGTQGPLTFAALDADGTARNDAAVSVDYGVSTPDRVYNVDVQDVAVNGAGGLHDSVASLAAGYLNPHSHEIVFANYASESGATVQDPGRAKYTQFGVGYTTATTSAFVYDQSIGSQFAPVDAFVAQNDISGLGGLLSQTWPFKPDRLLHDINVTEFVDRMHDAAGGPSQNQTSSQVNFDFSDLLTVHVFSGTTGIRTTDGEFLPFDTNGVLFGYKYATSTPTYVQYQSGPYYHGTLDAWTYLATLQVAPRVHLTLETDEDQYLTQHVGETRTNQWLERASLDFQINRETQLDVGVRRLVGSFLPIASSPADFSPVSGGNVSLALHFLARDGKSEVYAVYGDPNSFSTTPAVFLKYIRYIGAPKGT